MSMKKLVTAAALVLLADIIALAGFAPSTVAAAPPQQEGQPEQRTITVTGYGTAYGAPDIVRVVLGVETINSDILTAMEEANTRMDAVIQSLVASGVAREDIRTEYFSIYQDYPYGGPDVSGEDPQVRYRVSNTVNVTVRDTENVAQLLADAVSAGANVVNYIQFDIADRASLESEARQDAVSDARERAQELADTLGLTLGDAVQVEERTDLYSPVMGLGGGGGAGAAVSAPPISQGQLSVSMAVTITFAVG